MKNKYRKVTKVDLYVGQVLYYYWPPELGLIVQQSQRNNKIYYKLRWFLAGTNFVHFELTEEYILKTSIFEFKVLN